MRLAFELALVGIVFVACTGGGSVNAQPVPFRDHGTTQQSGNDDGPRIVAGADAAATGLVQLAPSQDRDPARLYIGVFAGTQRTGGYAVRVDAVERSGDRLAVRATFSAPAPGVLTIQVITSPAQLVSIDAGAVAGVRDVVLVDQSGAERARVPVPQGHR